MFKPIETPETADLIILFPRDYPNSALYARYMREGEQQAAEDAATEEYIRRNFGDCGAPLHTMDGWYEDHIDRLTEIYGYGPPPGYGF